jgi:uncharacterized protein
VILTDVNVLVYAFRTDSVDHDAYRDWLASVVDASEPFAVSDLVLSGFLRVVTHPRGFARPSRADLAREFVSAIRDRGNAVVVRPGPRQWEIFQDLLERTGATGNLVPDAYLAALAIETGSEFITTDLDFSRFPGLRWRHPLRAA